MIHRDALREYTRGSLWVLPTLCVLIALVAGILLSLVDVGPNSPLAFQGTADDARSLLSAITSTMVTVIALLLGLAVVALQLPHVARTPADPRSLARDNAQQFHRHESVRTAHRRVEGRVMRTCREAAIQPPAKLPGRKASR